MKYCSKCGKELVDAAAICPGCGCAQDNQPLKKQSDSNNFGWAVLGFCIPVAGLILYLIWKDQTPLRAKLAGKGALVSAILSVVFYIIYAIIIGAAIGMGGF